MKKSTKILLCLSAAFISLGMVLVIGGLAAGAKLDRIFDDGLWNVTFSERRTSQFSTDGHYKVPAAGINELDIDWCAGEVSIESYEGQEIVMEESSSGELDEDNSLMFEIKGGTLKINSSPGLVGISFSEGIEGKKDLHIRIPNSMKLMEIDFEASNANLRVQDVSAGELKTDTVAGEVFLQRVSLGQLDVDSASGNVTVEASTIAAVEVDTVTGNFIGELLSCPRSFSFEASSGDVELRLPADSQFTVRKEGIGGDLQSEFEGIYRNEMYVVGNGSAQIEMDTVKGSLHLLKANTPA